MIQVRRSPYTDLVLSKQSKKEMLLTARATNQTDDYPTLKNRPESFIYDAISLISIDDNSIKLTINGESYNLCLHLPRYGSENSLLFLNVSASPAEVLKWEPHSFHVSAYNAMTRKHDNRGRGDIMTKFK